MNYDHIVSRSSETLRDMFEYASAELLQDFLDARRGLHSLIPDDLRLKIEAILVSGRDVVFGGQHFQIGGYGEQHHHAVQENKDKTLLLQVGFGSLLTGLWKNNYGVVHYFISPEDLKQKDFGNVITSIES